MALKIWGFFLIAKAALNDTWEERVQVWEKQAGIALFNWF